jgi:hypothetical protein
MAWYERYIFAPPSEPTLVLQRAQVEGDCPECGGSDVRQYPIANHLGPRIVTKCQDCMHVVEMRKPRPDEPWPPFRAVTYDWDASPAERAARDGTADGVGTSDASEGDR